MDHEWVVAARQQHRARTLRRHQKATGRADDETMRLFSGADSRRCLTVTNSDQLCTATASSALLNAGGSRAARVAWWVHVLVAWNKTERVGARESQKGHVADQFGPMTADPRIERRAKTIKGEQLLAPWHLGPPGLATWTWPLLLHGQAAIQRWWTGGAPAKIKSLVIASDSPMHNPCHES